MITHKKKVSINFRRKKKYSFVQPSEKREMAKYNLKFFIKKVKFIYNFYFFNL